jgi:hypothetical protein
MQKVESIFEKDSGFDHKNITLKCDKVVPDSFLKAIEAGVTSEELEGFARAGLKIFKYKTQVTVHGIFGELHKNRIGGYVNLFQNKNLSIGIRYGAIDESKRERIKEKIRYAGFSYRRNSTDHCFEMVKRVEPSNKEESKQRLEAMLAIKAKIDTSLFTGGVYIYTAQAFGLVYIVLEVHVSTIPEKNVDKFWQSLVSQETIDAAIEAKRLRDEAYKVEQEAARKAEKAVTDAAMATAAPDLAYLEKTYPKVTGEPIEGVFLKVGTNYRNELEYTVKYVYKPKGARLFKHNDTNYPTMQAALAHVAKEGCSDSPCRGKIVNRFRIDSPAPVTEKAAKAKAEVQAVKADGLSLIRYSDKCYAVIGETKPVKETLSKLGCKFNGYLNIGNEKQAGWLVWGNILDKVATALQLPIPA